MTALDAKFLSKRDPDLDDPEFDGFFYSDTSRTIRYGILLGIIFVFFAFILLSYQHAAIRMKKGLAPLPYHRWLISRKRRAELLEPRAQPEDSFTFYQYEHQLHAVPPPAYNPNYVQPPSYPGPPEAATKTAPQQCLPPSYPGNIVSNSASSAGPSSSAQQRT